MITESVVFILSLVGILFISAALYAYIEYRRYKSVIYKTFYNTLHCGKESCDPDIDDNLTLPDIIGEEYNKVTARYCIDLIQRVYTNYNNYDMNSPTELKIELTVSYDKYKNIFGVLWSTNNTLFIVFRGTLNLEDWLKDLSYTQNFYIESKKNNNSQSSLSDINIAASVHSGFYNIYSQIKQPIIDKINELDPTKTKKIVITGHSLGSAIATICAVDLNAIGYTNSVTYIFASPRIGNQKFAEIVQNISLYSIINSMDIVPTIPPAVAPNFSDQDSPNIFVDSGKILLFSENWQSIYNNHGLGIYTEYLPETL